MTNNASELSTREQILHMLKTRSPLSVKDMTAELNITEMAVRRHLSTLERDGFIETSMIRQAMGRPTAVYRLTQLADAYFPKTYHNLALDLLGELEQENGEALVNLLFERRKNKLQHKYEASMSEHSFDDKVRRLTEIQNDNGYMAECESSEDGGYILKEYNCPIGVVANQYKQACRCELDLFESILNTEVNRTECLAEGGNKCVYHITHPSKNSESSS